MNRLENLVRLHKLRLDEARRHVAELETLAETLTRRIASLAEEVAAEGRRADASFDARLAFPAYGAAAAERRQNLARSLEMVADQIEAGREVVAAAFREMKKYEIAQASRQRRTAETVSRREQSRLDEVALNGFRQRQSG